MLRCAVTVAAPVTLGVATMTPIRRSFFITMLRPISVCRTTISTTVRLMATLLVRSLAFAAARIRRQFVLGLRLAARFPRLFAVRPEWPKPIANQLLWAERSFLNSILIRIIIIRIQSKGSHRILTFYTKIVSWNFAGTFSTSHIMPLTVLNSWVRKLKRYFFWKLSQIPIINDF